MCGTEVLPPECPRTPQWSLLATHKSLPQITLQNPLIDYRGLMKTLKWGALELARWLQKPEFKPQDAHRWKESPTALSSGLHT